MILSVLPRIQQERPRARVQASMIAEERALPRPYGTCTWMDSGPREEAQAALQLADASGLLCCATGTKRAHE